MSFNRRQNRIAGPGFHLNVRYDDQTMAEAMSVRPTKQLLQIGRTRRENFDVKENELLVCMKDGAMYHDGYTHCFSMANGLKATSGVDAVTIQNEILSKVQYVGVATTEYQPSKAYSEQGFVAQVGGVVTLINEGQETLKPGDSVSLGLNLKINKRITRDKGIPRDKIRFCLTKTKPMDDMIMQALVQIRVTDLPKLPDASVRIAEIELLTQKITEAMRNDKTKVQSLLTLKKKALNELVAAQGAVLGSDTGLKDFLQAYQDLNKRVIGKVASYARQGDRVEVILQPRNPY